MRHLIKTLITATTLAILTLNPACAAGSTDTGSQILNGQVNLNASVSTLNTSASTIYGDVVGQSVAGGNAVNITTMNDTTVSNSQYNKSTTIASTINADVGNVAGSVGYTSQAACNSASISTDPTTVQVQSGQDCESIDPSSTLNAQIQSVGGNVGLASISVGNTFEEDTNAPNAPIETNQINTSLVQSKISANAFNIGGTFSASSTAIGNTAQIVHYSTN